MVTPSAPVVVDRAADGVATITISNPGKKNALPLEGWHELARIVAELDADPGVWAIVLQGDGADFSSGLDVSTLREQPEGAKGAEIASVTAPAERAIIGCSKPVIAKIRGYCIGGGMLLSSACDLRIAAADSILGITPAKMGIVYPQPSVERLVQLVGPAFAKRLLFTAEFVSAERAYHAGLLDDVVDPVQLDDHVDALLRRMAALSKLSIHASKAMIDAIAAGRPEDGDADRWAELSRTSGEQGEGVSAFLERRPAQFPWRPGEGA